MDDIKSMFEQIEDENIMYNLLMFLLSYFVNRGLLEIHWNVDTQRFIYVVSDSESFDEDNEDDAMQIDPDDILSKMLNRKKKQ